MVNDIEKIVLKKASIDKQLMWKWIIAIISIFSVLSLIFIKLQNPNFNLKIFYIIFGIISVMSIILFFGFSILKKFKDLSSNESKMTIPKIASNEVIKKVVNDIVISEDYQNHIKHWLDVKKRVGIVGDVVYSFEIEPEYKDFQSEIWYIIVNANLINEIPAVLTGLDSTKSNSIIVGNQMNKSFIKPDKEHSISRTKIFNPVTQTYQETESNIVLDDKNTKVKVEEKDIA